MAEKRPAVAQKGPSVTEKRPLVAERGHLWQEQAICGRKEAGCGGTTAHLWGEEGGPSVAGPQPMCGVVSGKTICGVCLKNCF